jgi:hypothetical protein
MATVSRKRYGAVRPLVFALIIDRFRCTTKNPFFRVSDAAAG